MQTCNTVIQSTFNACLASFRVNPGTPLTCDNGILYWNGQNLCVHQLLAVYLGGSHSRTVSTDNYVPLLCVTSDVIRSIVVRRRPNRMLTYVIT